jgi:hypothetical protein
MSFQLLDIALYNASGERRELHFRPGQVNIITGGSKTGKTALIDIVDYCLGRNTYSVPAGVIRDTVTWYVLRIQSSKGQTVIGRPVPQGGHQTTSDVFLSVGGNVALPAFSELTPNTNTGALTSYLTELSGIAPNEHTPSGGQSRNPLQATIRHSSFYLFQPQYRIADRTVLFYRQNEDFVPQAIKDTLPYFLGAVPDDRYQRLQELRRARRDLKMLERRKADEDAMRGQDNSRALGLYAEARQAGLVSDAPPPAEFDELTGSLRDCLNWTPENAPVAQANTLGPLQDQREILLVEATKIQGEIEAAKAFGLEQDGFSQEVIEQKNRLESIGLFDSSGEQGAVCPFCNHDLETPVPSATQIQQSLANLNAQMLAVARQQPRLEQYINEKQDRLAVVMQQANETKAAIEAVISQEESLQNQRSQQSRQARVVGRISLFLDSVSQTTTDSDLARQIAEATDRVKALEEELADENIEDRLASCLRIISNRMSQWSRQLELEHSEFPLELDLQRLTVVAHRDTGPVAMNEMGSGENWMGYHLISHFALHQWFVKKNRPVPRFLMLDQPTQVYFPADTTDMSVDDLENEDRQAVERLFRWILEVTQSMEGQFQVIITDHADLKDEWFQTLVAERWRGGVKLIPASWYE